MLNDHPFLVSYTYGGKGREGEGRGVEMKREAMQREGRSAVLLVLES